MSSLTEQENEKNEEVDIEITINEKMILLCHNLMNNILDFIPNNPRYLNNFSLSCKLFESILQPRIDNKFWDTLVEFLGEENCEGLKNNTLKKLIIPRYNAMDELHPWVECFPIHLECLYSILKKNTSIEDIKYKEGTHLKYGESKKLAQILKTNTTWRSINFSRIFLDAKPFCVALKTNKTLKEITFYGNIWDTMDINNISEMLKVNSSLESLCLNESYGVDDDGVILLASALKVNSSLKYLGLGACNEFGIKSMIELAKALKINKSLTSLDLGCDKDGFGEDADEIADVMGKMLQYNSTLKELDLSLAKISDIGMTKLAAGLKNNNSLEQLGLRYCIVGDKGAKAIGSLLKTNSSLKDIDLYNNNIGNEGAMYLYHGMVENNTLERITFSPEDLDPEIDWETWGLLRELVIQKENLTIHNGWDDEPI